MIKIAWHIMVQKCGPVRVNLRIAGVSPKQDNKIRHKRNPGTRYLVIFSIIRNSWNVKCSGEWILWRELMFYSFWSCRSSSSLSITCTFITTNSPIGTFRSWRINWYANMTFMSSQPLLTFYIARTRYVLIGTSNSLVSDWMVGQRTELKTLVIELCFDLPE